MRLLLLRHAEAQRAPGQADTDLFSLGDYPLSERGRAQAKAAAQRVAAEPLEAVYASPALRARETAETLGRPVTIMDGLREFPFGTGDYATILARILGTARAMREDPDPLLPDGSRYQSHVARFSAALDEIRARHACCAVVAHGVANRAWLAQLLGMPPHAMLRLDQDHACVNVIDWREGRAFVARLNG